MKDLIKETLEKIKKEEIKPTSRWVFLAKNISTWLVFVCLIILGVISFSLIIFLGSQLDWEICSQMGLKLHWLSPVFYIPLLWFFLSIIFAFLAFWEVRKTKKGYRYNRSIIILILAAIFSVFGFFFYFSKESEKVHHLFSGQNSHYKKMSELKERQWSQPELGFLGGMIRKINSNDNQFEIIDFEEKNWLVNYDANLIILPGALLLPNERVKILGQEMDPISQLNGGAKTENENEEENIFQAREIRPWETRDPIRECPGCEK